MLLQKQKHMCAHRTHIAGACTRGSTSEWGIEDKERGRERKKQRERETEQKRKSVA